VTIECTGGGGGYHPSTFMQCSFLARKMFFFACRHFASVNRSLLQYMTSSQNLRCCSLVRLFSPAASCWLIDLPVAGEMALSSFEKTRSIVRTRSGILTACSLDWNGLGKVSWVATGVFGGVLGNPCDLASRLSVITSSRVFGRVKGDSGLTNRNSCAWGSVGNRVGKICNLMGKYRHELLTRTVK